MSRIKSEEEQKKADQAELARVRREANKRDAPAINAAMDTFAQADADERRMLREADEEADRADAPYSTACQLEFERLFNVGYSRIDEIEFIKPSDEKDKN